MLKNKPQVDVINGDEKRRNDYVQTLQAIVSEGHCPFCEEHLIKHHTKPILFRNKDWLVTSNAWPYEGAKYHFLLISRMHIENAADVKPEVWKSLGAAYKRLTKEYKLSGATLFMRSGNTKITGASVQHLHAQVIVGSVRKTDSKPIAATVGFQK